MKGGRLAGSGSHDFLDVTVAEPQVLPDECARNRAGCGLRLQPRLSHLENFGSFRHRVQLASHCGPPPPNRHDVIVPKIRRNNAAPVKRYRAFKSQELVGGLSFNTESLGEVISTVVQCREK
ncbi:MAG: hypothetical protein M3Y33_15000 [Actinomycetota bacterium]|nr:hypothetical protein [Actinomycetota bacterium]